MDLQLTLKGILPTCQSFWLYNTVLLMNDIVLLSNKDTLAVGCLLLCAGFLSVEKQAVHFISIYRSCFKSDAYLWDKNAVLLTTGILFSNPNTWSI